MANRNFRRNLALLCALAGGATALSSMNVSTSAMEHRNYKMEKYRVGNLVRDFKERYNEQINANLTINQKYYRCMFLLDHYRGFMPDDYTALDLANAIAYSYSKDKLKDVLESDCKHLEENEKYADADYVRMVMHYLFRDNGINWAA